MSVNISNEIICLIIRDSAACFANNVENPGRNYPLGVGLAILIVFLSLFLPVLIGTGVDSNDYSSWHDGHFTYIAVKIGGPWLGSLLMFASSVTNIGLFEAEMSTDSWQVNDIFLLRTQTGIIGFSHAIVLALLGGRHG